MPEPVRHSATRIRFAVFATAALVVCGCRNEQEKAVRALEQRSVPANADGLTAAVGRNDVHLLPLFETAGVRVPAPAPGAPSLLQQAAATGSWNVVAGLIPLADADCLNHPGPDGRTILEMAAADGRPDIAESLLDAGALPAAARAGGTELLRTTESFPELFPRLVSLFPAGDNPAFRDALLRAAEAGNADRLTQLLARGAAPDAAAEPGGPLPLDAACLAPHPDAVRLLIDAGATASLATAALPRAIRHHDAALCDRLLAAGAGPETPGPDGCSPLGIALASGSPELIDALLARGADPAGCVEPAMAAATGDLLAILLRHELCPDSLTAAGNPLLVQAVVDGRDDLANLLLDHGANPEFPGADGQSPLVLATIHRRSDAIRPLIEHGADPNQGFAVPVAESVFAAIDNEHFKKWLARDEGLTPLMLAASRGDAEMVRLLIDNGAKRGRQTKNWKKYAINFACDTAHITAAQILLGRRPETETTSRNVVISLSKQRATLYRDGKVVRSSRISTGRRSHPTPKGSYVITDKQTDWVSSIYDVPMPFFMRLSCRDIGLHQGAVPGYPASHGCIRMPRDDARAFFKVLKIGDPVTIEP